MKKNIREQILGVPNRTLCMAVLVMALIYNVIFGCVRNPLLKAKQYPQGGEHRFPTLPFW